MSELPTLPTTAKVSQSSQDWLNGTSRPAEIARYNREACQPARSNIRLEIDVHDIENDGEHVRRLREKAGMDTIKESPQK